MSGDVFLEGSPKHEKKMSGDVKKETVAEVKFHRTRIRQVI